MPSLLKQIEDLGTIALSDVIVYRHMLADIPPSRANTRGARWNPPDVAAIYASFEREKALAEAEYYLSLQTPPLRVRRTIYRIRVRLHRVVELRDPEVLDSLGVHDIALPDFAACQRVGGAAAHLGCDGLIVPSARREQAFNLVIYPDPPRSTPRASRSSTAKLCAKTTAHPSPASPRASPGTARA